MKISIHWLKYIWISTVIIIISGCGGGGGGKSSTSSSVSGMSVTVYYKRFAEDYGSWGLHLWGDAIASSTATTWSSPRVFNNVIDGWSVAIIPLVDLTKNFNFIIHRGDIKSPLGDLSFIPSVSGQYVWVVQDTDTLFFSEAEADAYIETLDIGNASSALDLSDVAVLEATSDLPNGWNKSANFMEIFVRSYQDSDGDGHGDFQGLISRLDYLQDLGITGIWLMPIMESSDDDHGYSVTDYRSVESDYGTMEDFETLISEAHARGIGVIIDYVLNHSSFANPLFMDASTSVQNDKHDWYIFSNTNPGWSSWTGPSWHSSSTGFYYGVFNWGLPDFDLSNPDVVDYHADNLRFWLNKGVDGFRFDATGVLFENGANAWRDQPENHPLLAEMQAVINSYENRYMICEAPDAPALYAISTSCVNAFAFGYQGAIKNTAITRSLSNSLVDLLNSSTGIAMPLILSNHDAFAGNRPIGELDGNSLGDYKVAAAITTLVSSTPFAYYGEEIGMANGSESHDGKLRTPMSWTSNATHAGFSTVTPYRGLSTNVATYNVATQTGVTGSLLEHYRALYTVRKENPILGAGILSLQSLSGDSHVILTRTNGVNIATVLINLSLSTQSLSVNTGVSGADFVQKLPATNVVITSNESGSLTISVPAQSAAVLVREVLE